MKDGIKWFVNMEWDYRQQGPRQFSGILVQEYDCKAKKLVGKVHKIFLGTDIQKTFFRKRRRRRFPCLHVFRTMQLNTRKPFKCRIRNNAFAICIDN